MKVLNKVVIGMASLVLLTACAPKCSYADFHSKAVAAMEKAKEKSFSVTIKGTYKDDNGDKKEYDNVALKWEKGAFTYTNVTHLDEVAAAIVLNVITADVIGENENSTYYAGSTFKVVTKDDNGTSTTTWNKFALPTQIKGSDSNLKITYK